MEWKWRLIWFCPLSGHSALTDLIIITKPLKPQVSFSSKRRYETHLYSLHAKTTHVKKYLWWGVSSPAVWSSWPHQLSFTPFLKLMVFCIKLKKKGLENVSGGGGASPFGPPANMGLLTLSCICRSEDSCGGRFVSQVRSPCFCSCAEQAAQLGTFLCGGGEWLTPVTHFIAPQWRRDGSAGSSVGSCTCAFLHSPPPPPQWLPAGNCVKKPTLRHFSFVFSLCGCLQVKSAKCKAFKATLEVQSD